VSPDIQPQAPATPPALSPQAAAPAAKPVDNLDGLTDDDISDRIMDFRLGLRSDIT